MYLTTVRRPATAIIPQQRQPAIPIIPQLTNIAQQGQPIVVKAIDEDNSPLKRDRVLVEQSIRRKLQEVTYNPYKAVWKEEVLMFDRNIMDGAHFVDVFNNSQRIVVGGRPVSVMKFLMISREPMFIAQLITALGLKHLTDTIDVFYNLLWYLNIAETPYAIGLTSLEKEYISGLNVGQLLNLLGPKYRGPSDRASLLFALVSGKSAHGPDVSHTNRYNLIITYPPHIVWTFAVKYNILNFDIQHHNVHPAHIYLALQPTTLSERVALAVNENNVDELMARYGVVIHPDKIIGDPYAKIKYFIKQIVHYEPIFVRNRNIGIPPIITGGYIRVHSALSRYTMRELIDTYEPFGYWSGYQSLIYVIYQETHGGSSWSLRHRYCNNDDTLNVVEAELHGDMDKDNPADPTFSYGVRTNYRCYQVNELNQSFREYDDGFHFRVPDWTPDIPGRPVQIDPITQERLMRDFPVESMRHLRDRLRDAPREYQVEPLLNKIETGLGITQEVAREMLELQNTYQMFNPDQQLKAKIYLAWLFTYGMWMRFWKGPGYPWPVTRVVIFDPDERALFQRCSPEDRDEHTFIQQAIYTYLTDEYGKDYILRSWIEILPYVTYNFQTDRVEITTAPIKNMLDELMLGTVCQGFAGDIVTQTGYYLITRILRLITLDQFNAFMTEMIPHINNIERTIVTYQLGQIKNPTANKEVERRVRILRERIEELNKTMIVQPPFDPTNFAPNPHT